MADDEDEEGDDAEDEHLLRTILLLVRCLRWFVVEEFMCVNHESPVLIVNEDYISAKVVHLPFHESLLRERISLEHKLSSIPLLHLSIHYFLLSLIMLISMHIL